MKARNKFNARYALLPIAVVIVMPLSTIAQKAMKLPLDVAVSMSLQNSGKLKIATEKVNEATANYHEARNNRLPDLKVSASYLRLNSPDVNLKIKTGSSSTSNGGEQASSGGTPKVDQAAYGLVNASIPLFSGMRIKYGIESAKYLQQAARLDAEKDKEEIIQNTISSYCNLYKAMKSVDLVKENLAREQQRVADFFNLEKNGLMARNDLLKAQLQQSNIELSLLEAESNLNITRINMALMLGLPEGTEMTPDTTGIVYPADPGSMAQWELTALEHRKDKAALASRVDAAAAAVKSTSGEYYPGLALTGGYIGANVPNVLTLTNALNVGIGLQYNIGSIWKTGAKVDAARARLHQIEATEGIVADQIRLEISNAYQQYLLSLKKITVYRKSIEQANENYRITKNKFDNNLVTTTELLDADVAQLQAELNYTFSRADAMVAFKSLQQAAGILE
jgi:outer membrane protein